MKKVFALILCGALLLCACGSDHKDKQNGYEAKLDVHPTVREQPPEKKSIVPTQAAAVQTENAMDQFFIEITPGIARSEIEKTAKKYGLNVSFRNTGTGIYIYRVSDNANVAKSVNPEKGSVVTASFNALRNDALIEIRYFDMERMILGCWDPEKGYGVSDLNYPQIISRDSVSGETSALLPVSSAKEIVEYKTGEITQPNLLEALFLFASEKTTKDDLLRFVSENGLHYNSRGVGNEQVISYTKKVGDKYGEEGSYITFSTDKNGKVTSVSYYYYPAYYRSGLSAHFFSEAYAYSEIKGFVLKSKAGSMVCSSAEELLQKLHN